MNTKQRVSAQRGRASCRFGCQRVGCDRISLPRNPQGRKIATNNFGIREMSGDTVSDKCSMRGDKVLRRAKLWVADRLGLTRLNHAVSYLLARDVNVLSATASGLAGNTALRDALFHLLAVLRPDVFCEVGANDGTTSLAVRATAPACEVHAYEANPEIYVHCAVSLAQQGVIYRNLAVSDANGRVTVHAPRTLSRAYVDGRVVPASIVEERSTGKTSMLLRDEEATYDSFDVEARTLDGLFEDRIGPDGRVSFCGWTWRVRLSGCWRGRLRFCAGRSQCSSSARTFRFGARVAAPEALSASCLGRALYPWLATENMATTSSTYCSLRAALRTCWRRPCSTPARRFGPACFQPMFPRPRRRQHLRVPSSPLPHPSCRPRCRPSSPASTIRPIPHAWCLSSGRWAFAVLCWWTGAPPTPRCWTS